MYHGNEVSTSTPSFDGGVVGPEEVSQTPRDSLTIGFMVVEADRFKTNHARGISVFGHFASQVARANKPSFFAVEDGDHHVLAVGDAETLCEFDSNSDSRPIVVCPGRVHDGVEVRAYDQIWTA